MVDDPVRCAWARNDPAYLAYHDQEWGVPLHDDRRLFESLVLQGAQAGLSWLTILKKRDHYRLAFEDFDPAVVAEFDASRIKDLMKNPGLVRNRRKIESARGNARAFLEVQEEIGSFDRFIWSFVDYRPIQ
ncbi:MAG: DNA-3-methyladenine glycosylase I, partial [Proteobacteria bacterium]|nr:DNA-3-methyladenine glycosylase I [Pseudomonadota bacterium]